MAQVIIDDTNLTNIAIAIRGKLGVTTKFKPSQMAPAINSITGSGSSAIPSEALKYSGNLDYVFANNAWNWFIEAYGGLVDCTAVNSCIYTFGSTSNYSVQIENIPFSITFVKGWNYREYDDNGQSTVKYGINCSHMFDNCYDLEALPELIYFEPSNMSYMFNGCCSLKDISTLNDADYKYIKNYGNCAEMFRSCYALRQIPSELLAKLHPGVAGNTGINRLILNRGFYSCLCLDELVGIPVDTETTTITENMFNTTFWSLSRAKNITFIEPMNGTYVKDMWWSNQYIDLSQYVGHCMTGDYATYIKRFGGFTEDTRITNDTSYALLKDNPDSWTTDKAYSRFNKTSAVNTIASLPYIHSSGTANTIRFCGPAGSKTDGGAINTMTEEQVAVATAKGWTVAYTNG
jgi:hypothetical protein